MSTAATPPRLVVYFSDGRTPLSNITTRPYTDVIFAFVVPTNATDLTLMGAGGAFGAATGPDPTLQANVQMVQKAGKHALLSFGGATVSSQSYQGYAADVDGLVNQLANDWILPYGFNGVDVDFEDSQAFMSSATYSGVDFLTSLTLGLARALPGKIITHAPQTPYWDPAAQYGNAYTQVWKSTGGAITWINNQFYSNAPWDGTAALQETWYGNIAATTGPSRLVLGELVALGGSPPAPVLPDGESVTGIIQKLQQTFGASLGGAMGWEFVDDTNGEWSTAMAAALGLGKQGGRTIMSGIHGADVSTPVCAEEWQTLQSEQGVSFGVVRCYRSNGTVDTSAPETVNDGWSAQLSAVDVYHFPSLAVGATLQVNDSVNALQVAGARFGTYWFDVEDGAGWSSSDHAANAAFLASLVQAAEALGLTVGIYASLSGWTKIMGSGCVQFARYLLWYAHWETPPNPSFSDFVPFGGWTRPSRKQYAGNQTSGGVSYDSNWCPQ